MKYAFILVPAIIVATLVFKFLFTPSRGRVVNLAKDDFQVQILKFESQNPGGKSVIIVPPTGGTNFLDRSYGIDSWLNDTEGHSSRSR